jgi:hypothetical protein|tara:strand:- start:1237 stop:1455 length:219 start_codon:yes stop_codon:yes gene_type:complete
MTKKKMTFEDFISKISDGDTQQLIDPSTMSPDELHLFFESIYADYLYFKDKKSKFAKQYGKLLSEMIKQYGH